MKNKREMGGGLCPTKPSQMTQQKPGLDDIPNQTLKNSLDLLLMVTIICTYCFEKSLRCNARKVSQSGQHAARGVPCSRSRALLLTVLSHHVASSVTSSLNLSLPL